MARHPRLTINLLDNITNSIIIISTTALLLLELIPFRERAVLMTTAVVCSRTRNFFAFGKNIWSWLKDRRREILSRQPTDVSWQVSAML